MSAFWRKLTDGMSRYSAHEKAMQGRGVTGGCYVSVLSWYKWPHDGLGFYSLLNLAFEI